MTPRPGPQSPQEGTQQQACPTPTGPTLAPRGQHLCWLLPPTARAGQPIPVLLSCLSSRGGWFCPKSREQAAGARLLALVRSGPCSSPKPMSPQTVGRQSRAFCLERLCFWEEGRIQSNWRARRATPCAGHASWQGMPEPHTISLANVTPINSTGKLQRQRK